MRHSYLLALLLLLAGCWTVSVKTPCGEISRSGMASDLAAAEFELRVTADCAHVLRIRNASDAQTEAVRAIVEGAVQGAAKGLKP